MCGREVVGSGLVRPSAAVLNVPTGTVNEVGPKAAANITYTILGAWDGDPDNRIISYKTPLGAALLGKKPGDTVTVKAGGAEDDYTIVNISRYADKARA